MSEANPAFTGVVMAGGNSTRMGRDKALLKLPDGRTLLERAAETLRAAGAAEIIVSVAKAKTYGLPGVRKVLDAKADCGPIGGLHACLAASQESFCVLLAVDVPAMTATYLRALLRQCAPGRGVVPMIDGSAEPLAAVYPKEAALEVVHALESGDYSLQKLIHRLEECGKIQGVQVADADRELFANWNSPEDCR